MIEALGSHVPQPPATPGAAPTAPALGPGGRLTAATGRLAGRLAQALRTVFSDEEDPVAGATDGRKLEDSLVFLEVRARASAEIEPGPPPELETQDPLGRLALGLGLADVEVDLLLLTGMAEEHEGYADLFSRLHPSGRPAPTPALAALLFCASEAERRSLRHLLLSGPAARAGALGTEGDGPLFNRSLRLADALWPALGGVDAWPEGLEERPAVEEPAGLEGWLGEPEPARAVEALSRSEPCQIVVTGNDADVAFQRAGALAAAAAMETVSFAVTGNLAPDQERLLSLHCLVRGAVPLLRLEAAEIPGSLRVPELGAFPGPVLVGVPPQAEATGRRPVLGVDCRRLGPTELAEVWRAVLPAFEGDPEELAVRFPVEPYLARRVATDLMRRSKASGGAPRIEDVAASLRSRTGAVLRAGVQRRRPTAGWGHLVLPESKLELLRSAVARLEHQAQVLDRWRFLHRRPGARGVRMLLAGPPGTGKTLSAEVLAAALGVDLLIVDLARVVSKWIGETEKNLAEVFDAAERARAVLLFDEADALFGRRTEVSDAHDRYANLETAFLLARLERFEGLAVLATNLRQNIDEAFTRRLEVVVDFTEPGRPERRALWRCHLPPEAPLAADVDLDELAARYRMTGAMIKNAAVAAAFDAAAGGTAIRRRHFLAAIRRELEKSGKTFSAPPEAAPVAGAVDPPRGGSEP